MIVNGRVPIVLGTLKQATGRCNAPIGEDDLRESMKLLLRLPFARP